MLFLFRVMFGAGIIMFTQMGKITCRKKKLFQVLLFNKDETNIK